MEKDKINVALRLAKLENGLIRQRIINLVASVAMLLGLQYTQLSNMPLRNLINRHFPNELSQDALMDGVDFGVTYFPYVNIVLGGLLIMSVVFFIIVDRRTIKEKLQEIDSLKNQIAQLEENHPLILPAKLDSERAQKYIKKALDAGLLCITSDGIRRVSPNCSKIQLAYLLSKIYIQDKGYFPDNELSTLFGEQRLGKSVSDLFENTDAKPRNASVIDALFADS